MSTTVAATALISPDQLILFLQPVRPEVSVRVDGEQLPFFGVIGVFREPSTPTPHYHHPTNSIYNC